MGKQRKHSPEYEKKTNRNGHTYWAKKSFQTNLPNIPKSRTQQEIMKENMISQAVEAVIETIEEDGIWSMDLPATIQTKLENAVQTEANSLKQDIEYMIWENTIPFLREENINKTFDSSDSMLFSAGNSRYLSVANKIEKELENLENQIGEFQIKILHDGEIVTIGDNTLDVPEETFDDLSVYMYDAWIESDYEKGELLNHDTLASQSLRRMMEHGLEEGFMQQLTETELLEAYEVLELAE